MILPCSFAKAVCMNHNDLCFSFQLLTINLLIVIIIDPRDKTVISEVPNVAKIDKVIVSGITNSAEN